VTFSIVARDPATNALGIAVESRALAVGSVVPWALANVGAIATQSDANPRYGADGLRLLQAGLAPDVVLAQLTGADPMRDDRQVGIVDAMGRSASFSGQACSDWAGGRSGQDYAAQGNLLAGAQVVDALADTFLVDPRPFPERLVACLAAAQMAGGDRRGQQAAALLVVREGASHGGLSDRWIDLRVDDHAMPITELARLLDLHRLHFELPTVGDLVAIDELLADELKQHLSRAGFAPDRQRQWSASPASWAVPEVPGEPRSYPFNWTTGWQATLVSWIEANNLWRRGVPTGWIDRRVLQVLRQVPEPSTA
jgi:uncharacterized Ntn-hydrolase superfamily protein